MMNTPIYPYGHFYSPIVNTSEVDQKKDLIWHGRHVLTAVEMNDDKHIQVLDNWFPKFIADYDYPDLGDPLNPDGFFNHNDQFSWLDSRTLFVMLRQLTPKKIIEVGSGYSSLLIADVNRRFLNLCMDFICIEPYPRDFLRAGHKGISGLIEKKVQDVPINELLQLTAGDILFIDSSHVAKTGSDVVHLFLEVLPRLQPGVIIHIHDIFLPCDYPEEWVIKQNRSWNEQYMLHALLIHSNRFRVLFGCAYAAAKHSESVIAALASPDDCGMSGGSFWLEVNNS